MSFFHEGHMATLYASQESNKPLSPEENASRGDARHNYRHALLDPADFDRIIGARASLPTSTRLRVATLAEMRAATSNQ